MPRIFVTVRLSQEKQRALSTTSPEQSISFPDRELYPFYETDSQDKAKQIIESFQQDREYNKSSEAYEAINEFDLDVNQYDDLEGTYAIIEFILNTRSDNPGIWRKKGLPNDSKTQLLLKKYHQAKEWEHSINKNVEGVAENKPYRHGPDFRSVHWFGLDYTFTATQAACVQPLWEAYEAGTPDIGGETLLQEAGSESSRLIDVFKNHPAWGNMIISGNTKGTYRLVEP